MSSAIFVHACMREMVGVDLAGNWYFISTKRQLITFLLTKAAGKIQVTCDLGVHSAGEIPVPIPNTEVKPGSGDYTAYYAGN